MKAIIAALAVCLACGPAWAEQQAVTDIQSMLAECGFNPGPVDGLWGSRTASAAAAYVRAHGDQLDSGDRARLMAQVDAYRVGDQGPCPTGKQASGPVESTGGAGDQAQVRENDEPEPKREKRADLVEAINGAFSGKIYELYAGDGEHYGRHSLEAQIQRDTITVTQFTDMRTERNRNGLWYVTKATSTARIPDIEYAEKSDYDDSIIVLRCRNNSMCVDHLSQITRSPESARGNRTPEQERYTGQGSEITFNYFELSERTELADGNFVVDAFNRLIAHYGRAEDNPVGTGKTAKCIEWADLGSVSTGAWRNGNGRVTKGLEAGDLGKAHDRLELVKNYEASHQHCLDMNENTMRQAIVDMVIIGRKAKDVDNEKRRIRDYFQSNVRECQAEFTRRFRKYEIKFCR